MPSILLFARLTLLTGLRSRMTWLLVFLALLLLGVGALAGAFSARQPLVVACDVALSGLHFSLLFLTLIWVQELLQKDRDRRTTDWVLAYPVDRMDYLAGKMLGIAVLLACATVLLSLPIWLIGHFAGWGYAASSQPVFGVAFAWTLFGTWLESLVILCFAAWFFALSTTPYLPLAAALCFALAARSLGSALDFLMFSPDAEAAFRAQMLPILQILRWIVPDLGALDWRASMLYDLPLAASRYPASLVALAYAGMFAALALVLFHRRQLR
ncbi:MAG: hypothetical protein H6R07_2379 [Proteobacteria bacterium]|nr:hypothetical protein [Pseudomonadota bacterium]